MKVEDQLYRSVDEQSGWYRTIAWPLSKLYGTASRIYHRRYDREDAQVQRLSVPVISVGNLTVGGTGKSPVVISVCQYLSEKGKQPGVLTRGYGTKMPSPGWMAIRDDKTLFGTVSPPDEAAMEAAALDGVPIVIGPDRWQAANQFSEKFPEIDVDIWVMDDGFQHRHLHRDLDIVCADDRLRFGNRELLPAGPLREPIGSLRRADCLLWTRGSATGRAPTFDFQTGSVPAYTLQFDFEQPIPLDAWYGNAKKVDQKPAIPAQWIVVCAIAQPERFTNKVLEKGMRVVDTLYFRDHQDIGGPKFGNWYKKFADRRDVGVLITAKDASRNSELFRTLQHDVYVQPLGVRNGECVWDEVLRLYI